MLVVLVVLYASSMRAYLQQKSDINSLKSQIAKSQSAIAADRKEKARWNDPAYVEQEAREQFGWVLPGETAYQVLDSHGKPITGNDKLTDPASVGVHKTVPEAWWTKVRSSMDAADHPQKLVKRPPPATKILPTPSPSQ
ncbi:MAG TPA: septum formation initiator family protein [Marmoricola sp.]|nr:septum formation initiator family protein [Marmoricola sp.]